MSAIISGIDSLTFQRDFTIYVYHSGDPAEEQFNLETAIEREKDVQHIYVHR